MKKNVVITLIIFSLSFIVCGCSNNEIWDGMPFYFEESYEEAYDDMKSVSDDVNALDNSISGKDVSWFGSDVNLFSVFLGVEKGDEKGLKSLSLSTHYILAEDLDYQETFNHDYEIVVEKLKEAYGDPLDGSTDDEMSWYTDGVDVRLKTEYFDKSYAGGNIGISLDIHIQQMKDAD